MYLILFVTAVSPCVAEYFWDPCILVGHPLVQDPFKVT